MENIENIKIIIYTTDGNEISQTMNLNKDIIKLFYNYWNLSPIDHAILDSLLIKLFGIDLRKVEHIGFSR